MGWDKNSGHFSGGLPEKDDRGGPEAPLGLLHTRCVADRSRAYCCRFTPPVIGKKSPETIELRQKVLDGCEQLIWDFFNAGGQCVIYDANNGRREQRHRVAEKFGKEGIHVVMLGRNYYVWFHCAPSLT
jgi:hypothetical protein